MYKFLKISIASIISILVVSCSDDGASAPEELTCYDLLPLEVGQYRVYDGNVLDVREEKPDPFYRTTDSFVVSEKKRIDGKDAFVLLQYSKKASDPDSYYKLIDTIILAVEKNDIFKYYTPKDTIGARFSGGYISVLRLNMPYLAAYQDRYEAFHQIADTLITATFDNKVACIEEFDSTILISGEKFSIKRSTVNIDRGIIFSGDLNFVESVFDSLYINGEDTIKIYKNVVKPKHVNYSTSRFKSITYGFIKGVGLAFLQSPRFAEFGMCIPEFKNISAYRWLSVGKRYVLLRYGKN